MDIQKATSRTWLEVDENALIENYHNAQALCHKDTTFIAVLKADAYGYGAKRVCKVLYQAGVRHFAVACMEEALELRRVLPDAWVLNMGLTPAPFITCALQNAIRMTVQSTPEIKEISSVARQQNIPAFLHVKLDTGLHRLGFSDISDLPTLLKRPMLQAEGVFSHLALRSREQSLNQIALFEAQVEALSRQGLSFPMVHLLDSIGLARYTDAQQNAVRVGAYLYGNVPPDCPQFTHRRAVGKLCTKITRIETVAQGEGIGYDSTSIKRTMRVATLAAGYVDGYARSLSNVGRVQIRGQLANVVGLVCMDQMMVDVTDIKDAQVGDRCVLLGESILLIDYAATGRLNRNEATAMIGRRVPRVYMSDGQVVDIQNNI